MNNKNLIAFDFDKWDAGVGVWTKNGNEVRLCSQTNFDADYPVIGWFLDGGVWTYSGWTTKGEYMINMGDHRKNLLMEPARKPFDLTAALNGAPVETKSGIIVLKVEDNDGGLHPIRVTRESGVSWYTKSGKPLSNIENDCLVMSNRDRPWSETQTTDTIGLAQGIPISNPEDRGSSSMNTCEFDTCVDGPQPTPIFWFDNLLPGKHTLVTKISEFGFNFTLYCYSTGLVIAFSHEVAGAQGWNTEGSTARAIREMVLAEQALKLATPPEIN